MRRRKTKVYVGGTFDLFHEGHVRLFKRAKNTADVVVVALNTDEFAEAYKGKRPVMSLKERMEVVKACKYVDVVDVNDGGEDSKPCILRNKPDFILHGDDWTGASLMKQLGITEAFLKRHNIRMVYAPYTKKISTSALKQRVRERFL